MPISGVVPGACDLVAQRVSVTHVRCTPHLWACRARSGLDRPDPERYVTGKMYQQRYSCTTEPPDAADSPAQAGALQGATTWVWLTPLASRRRTTSDRRVGCRSAGFLPRCDRITGGDPTSMAVFPRGARRRLPDTEVFTVVLRCSSLSVVAVFTVRCESSGSSYRSLATCFVEPWWLRCVGPRELAPDGGRRRPSAPARALRPSSASRRASPGTSRRCPRDPAVEHHTGL